MTAKFININNAAQDLANAAREAYAIEKAARYGKALMLSSHASTLEDAIDDEFQRLASLLGFSVTRIEPAALAAAE